MTGDIEIEPISLGEVIKSFGIVLAFCFMILLLILGIEFLFFCEMDFMRSTCF